VALCHPLLRHNALLLASYIKRYRCGVKAYFLKDGNGIEQHENSSFHKRYNSPTRPPHGTITFYKSLVPRACMESHESACCEYATDRYLVLGIPTFQLMKG